MADIISEKGIRKRFDRINFDASIPGWDRALVSTYDGRQKEKLLREIIPGARIAKIKGKENYLIKLPDDQKANYGGKDYIFADPPGPEWRDLVEVTDIAGNILGSIGAGIGAEKKVNPLMKAAKRIPLINFLSGVGGAAGEGVTDAATSIYAETQGYETPRHETLGDAFLDYGSNIAIETATGSILEGVGRTAIPNWNRIKAKATGIEKREKAINLQEALKGPSVMTPEKANEMAQTFNNKLDLNTTQRVGDLQRAGDLDPNKVTMFQADIGDMYEQLRLPRKYIDQLLKIKETRPITGKDINDAYADYFQVPNLTVTLPTAGTVSESSFTIPGILEAVSRRFPAGGDQYLKVFNEWKVANDGLLKDLRESTINAEDLFREAFPVQGIQDVRKREGIWQRNSFGYRDNEFGQIMGGHERGFPSEQDIYQARKADEGFAKIIDAEDPSLRPEWAEDQALGDLFEAPPLEPLDTVTRFTGKEEIGNIAKGGAKIRKQRLQDMSDYKYNEFRRLAGHIELTSPENMINAYQDIVGNMRGIEQTASPIYKDALDQIHRVFDDMGIRIPKYPYGGQQRINTLTDLIENKTVPEFKAQDKLDELTDIVNNKTVPEFEEQKYINTLKKKISDRDVGDFPDEQKLVQLRADASQGNIGEFPKQAELDQLQQNPNFRSQKWQADLKSLGNEKEDWAKNQRKQLQTDLKELEKDKKNWKEEVIKNFQAEVNSLEKQKAQYTQDTLKSYENELSNLQRQKDEFTKGTLRGYEEELKDLQRGKKEWEDRTNYATDDYSHKVSPRTPITMEQAERVHAYLNEHIDLRENFHLKDFKDAVMKDMLAGLDAISDPTQKQSLRKVLDEANSYHAMMMEQDMTKFVQPVLDRKTGQNVYDWVMAGSEEGRERILDLARNTPVEYFNQIRGGILDRMGKEYPGSESLDATIQSPGANFVENWRRMSDGAKDVMFGPKQSGGKNMLATIDNYGAPWIKVGQRDQIEKFVDYLDITKKTGEFKDDLSIGNFFAGTVLFGAFLTGGGIANIGFDQGIMASVGIGLGSAAGTYVAGRAVDYGMGALARFLSSPKMIKAGLKAARSMPDNPAKWAD